MIQPPCDSHADSIHTQPLARKGRLLRLAVFAIFALAAPVGIFGQTLPDNVLRTPDERFENIPGFDFEPNYMTLSTGLRLHYVDEGSGDPILLIHGSAAWSYIYRDMIPPLSQIGRVVAPDMIGHGRSDKYDNRDAYTFEMELEALEELLDELDLQNITMVGYGLGASIGACLATRNPDRFARLVLTSVHAYAFTQNYGPEANGGPTGDFLGVQSHFENEDYYFSWLVNGESNPDAYDAPMPDFDYNKALELVVISPVTADDPAALLFAECGQALAQWTKPVLVVDNTNRYSSRAEILRDWIPSAADEPDVRLGDSFWVPEIRGSLFAQHVALFIQRHPLVETETDDNHLINISTRGHVGSADSVMIAGFVIGGTQHIPVLIRGVGPSLASLVGFTDESLLLADPQIQVFRALEDGETELVTEIDFNYTATSITSPAALAAERAGAFPLVEGRDAPLYINLPPGAYTAVLSGANGEEGVALLEVYQVE